MLMLAELMEELPVGCDPEGPRRRIGRARRKSPRGTPPSRFITAIMDARADDEDDDKDDDDGNDTAAVSGVEVDDA